MAFEHANCMKLVEDEGIANMFEWAKTVAFDENAIMIGRIRTTKKEEVQLERLTEPYWQYKELFGDEKAEMLAP